MQEQNQISTLKDAARQMEKYFAQKGVTVPHTTVLEALSQGLGERNWRTVRGLLSRGPDSVQQPASRVYSTGHPEERFLVEGQHTRTVSAYSRAFSASSARQAAYHAVAYEWSLFGDAGELTVSEVLDRASGQRYDLQSFSSGDFRPHADAFDTLVQETRKVFTSSTRFDGKRSDETLWKTIDGTLWTESEWLESLAIVELFEQLLKSKTCREDVNCLLCDDFGTRGDLECILRFTDMAGNDWHDSMDGYLDKLLMLVEKCAVNYSESGQDARYQLRALMAVCPDDVSIAFAFELKYRK